jgi:hypothetical protein
MMCRHSSSNLELKQASMKGLGCVSKAQNMYTYFEACRIKFPNRSHAANSKHRASYCHGVGPDFSLVEFSKSVFFSRNYLLIRMVYPLNIWIRNGPKPRQYTKKLRLGHSRDILLISQCAHYLKPPVFFRIKFAGQR